jgi:branched-chain amino acid transport system substrate-binding protein
MKRLLMTLAVLAAWSPAARAEDILIGAIYPLTGNSSEIGADAQAAVSVISDIINTEHAPIPMLLGKGGGLPHLHGAHIKIIFADHQNDPQKARAEAERLITQDHVVAVIGSYTSATAATISQVTERYEVPYISMDNSSPTLNRRGLKWFFRTSPHDEMFTAAMFDFFQAMGAKTGRPVKSVALFYEDSIFGTDSSNAQKKLAAEHGIKIAADVRYRANSPSLSAEAQILKAANADVVLPSSYTSDAILIMRACNEIGYHPVIMAQATGFEQQSFITAAGPLAEGVMSRTSFALDAVSTRPAITAVNAMFKARAGKDMNDNTSRQVTSVEVLADAIDRAGSAKPEDIRAALVKTDIPGDQTIMPWKGIKFDETGQNTEATPAIHQITGGAFHTIYPFALAVQAPVWKVGE